jgi:hypothetical protein
MKPPYFNLNRENVHFPSVSAISGSDPVATMVSRQLRHASSSKVKLSTKSSSCRIRSSRAMRKMKALNCRNGAGNVAVDGGLKHFKIL